MPDLPEGVIVSTGVSWLAGIAIATTCELARPLCGAVELVRGLFERRLTRDFPRAPDFNFADRFMYFARQAGEPNFKRREPFRDVRAISPPPEHGP